MRFARSVRPVTLRSYIGARARFEKSPRYWPPALH